MDLNSPSMDLSFHLQAKTILRLELPRSWWNLPSMDFMSVKSVLAGTLKCVAAYSDAKDGLINAIAGGGAVDLVNANECTYRLIGFMCSVIVPRCTPLGDTGLVWREKVCFDACENLFEECADSVDQVLLEFAANALGMSTLCPTLTYDDSFTTDGAYSFSAASPPLLNVTVSGTEYHMQCQQPYSAINTTTQCLSDQALDANGVCQSQCPVGSKVYSQNQLSTLDTTLQVGGWVSSVCSVLMLATWSLQTRKRSFPSRFILFFSLCLFIMSTAMLISSIQGEDKMRCDNDTTPQTGSLSSACLMQGVLWMVGSTGMTLWWSAFVVTLFIMLNREVDMKKLREKEWMFHAVVWPLALIPAIIAASAGLIRYNPAGMLCFVSNEDGPGWQLALYYIPQLLLLLAGTAFMIVVMVPIVTNARRVGKWKAVRAVLRFLVFIPLYVIILVLFLTAAMKRLNITSVLEDNSQEYYDCLLEVNALNGNGGDYGNEEFYVLCADRVFPSVRHFPLDMTSRLLFSFMGLWILLIFGMQRRNWHFWKRQIRRFYVGRSSQSASGFSFTARWSTKQSRTTSRRPSTQKPPQWSARRSSISVSQAKRHSISVSVAGAEGGVAMSPLGDTDAGHNTRGGEVHPVAVTNPPMETVVEASVSH